MNTMTHKGYTARVEYDERDNIFVGRVLGVRSIISFHGTTVRALRSEFVHAIEDYLLECEEKGVKPEKPTSGKLLLRVRPEVHGKALVGRQRLSFGESTDSMCARTTKTTKGCLLEPLLRSDG